MFTVRKKCIFCDLKLSDTYFKHDYEIPVACYSTDNPCYNKIPYNILTCPQCKTIQTKYLGDLNEIYKVNHADSTGTLMKGLHNKVKDIIISYKNSNININNIVEIGAAKGVLSDLILDDNIVSKYYIIEPNYFGKKRENKHIINDYFENVKFEDYKDCNTLLISHVFEHFYNPKEILSVIQKNKYIENFILVWPDLEYYKDNKVYHVLNTEHTFYVDNNFIKDLLNNSGFSLINKEGYKGHSVIFTFKREQNLQLKELKNTNYNIDNYYNGIINLLPSINKFIETNNNKKIAIWPCSVHTQFLLMFLKNLKIINIIDNSPNKINKYIYGYNIKCLNFKKYVNDNNFAVILNGGVFNNEIKSYVTNKNVIYI